MEEHVIYHVNPDNEDRFVPQVASEDITREFEPEDITRVLDWEGVSDAPPDGKLIFWAGAEAEVNEFPSYHFCLRGGFLFYFEPDDVDQESGPYAIFLNPPAGIVPLENVIVEFPPGGRRIFREHAHTNARSGYEMVILHVSEDDDGEELRPPCFLITDSMGQREKWANALRERAKISKDTCLRAGYKGGVSAKQAANQKTAGYDDDESDQNSADQTEFNNQKASASAAATAAPEKDKKSSRRAKDAKTKSIERQVMDVKDDAKLAAAVVEFGAAEFDEKAWMENFFQVHNDFDAPVKCSQMEQWQSDMKKSLKGAVLEQYEYFVQASGEMTTMGREVASLRNLIKTQVETIREMKEVNFSGALDYKFIEKMEAGVSEDDLEQPPRLDQINGHESDHDLSKKEADDIFSDVSSFLSSRRGAESNDAMNVSTDEAAGEAEEDAPPIEIPEWLDDVAEEIAAVAREGRYNEAIDIHIKAKAEVADLIDKHERPTLYRLTKAQLVDLRRLRRVLDRQGKTICSQIEEILRRKNEALKQAMKRERSDTNSTITVVSPCALKDDVVYLHLLVKLGKTQIAEEQYAARRSLLLLEALNERPISGAGSVDLVIYAAQLSQSFFSCLANSVEGFLDLFLTSAAMPSSGNEENEDNDSIAFSSLHSNSIKSAPAGAVASVVLWCDSELAKFAAAFGGTRILSNLALSPPPRDGGPKKPRVVGESTDTVSKERTSAIEVAAQCIDQAFLYATQNLDSVGLPLAPRLAEYIRVRLKGCEGEVALLLDEKWQHLTGDWISSGTNGYSSRR